MERLASLLRWLACSTLLVGGLSLYALMRPSNVAEGLQALGMVFAALFRPLPLAALGVWLLARWGARYADLRADTGSHAGGSKVHSLETKLLQDADEIPGPTSVFAPRPEGRAARDRWRPRLEAHLKGKEPDIVLFIDELLAVAVHAGASDIHLQPLELSTRVQLRVGGELEEVATAPQAWHGHLVRRLKVLADLVPYETRQPQDGRFSIDTPRGAVDLRMSVVPTHHGEKVVLRLAAQGASSFTLDHLGMTPEQRGQLESLLALPQGVVVLCGPTGSGKTTTLYASLSHIHQQRGDTTNLATIEDPIEVHLPFLNQTQVRRAVGMSMAESLRALLRQDPNVLMVGEVRDRETAQVAIQGGLSGHLILTTLHADSALGVIPRLVDLGVEPFMVSSALVATVAQRLLRRLCPHCRHPAPPQRAQVERLRRLRVDTQGLSFYVAEGCAHCQGRGVAGRRAIFEMLTVDGELRRLIAQRIDMTRLYEEARRRGMRSLLESALALAVEGEIDLQEALRVAP